MDIKLHGAEEVPLPDLNKLYLVCWRLYPDDYPTRIEWAICYYRADDGLSGCFWDINAGYIVERDRCIGWLELPAEKED